MSAISEENLSLQEQIPLLVIIVTLVVCLLYYYFIGFSCSVSVHCADYIGGDYTLFAGNHLERKRKYWWCRKDVYTSTWVLFNSCPQRCCNNMSINPPPTQGKRGLAFICYLLYISWCMTRARSQTSHICYLHAMVGILGRQYLPSLVSRCDQFLEVLI